MRILIDLQGAQGANGHRGIGRYSVALAKALVQNRGAHEVFLALNGLFPETIEPIRSKFQNLLPQENIRVWEAPGPVCNLGNENHWRRRTAELVREAFLARFKPDIVIVSSLFEGLSDSAVTSVGSLSCTVPTAVILYDLIPLLHRDLYLRNAAVEAWYENKLDHLRRADLLLAISESSRQEAIRHLGFPAAAAVNISTAAEPHFQPQQLAAELAEEVRQRYGLRRWFVMYTGGDDPRKNIIGLIRAYAKLPRPLRALHQLAIVCAVELPSRLEFETLAKDQGLENDELVLTGFVPEEDLLALYRLCKVFVFPSLHEGFGLPALEAMACGRAVIGASSSSVPEVIGRDDALFDPRSDDAISEKLFQVLTDDAFRGELERHGLEQAQRFSWSICAQRTIAAVESWHANQPPAISRPLQRPRLAYVSPLPPERSGISDYSAELLPELSRHYEIDVIVAQDSVSDSWARANCTLRTVAWFLANAKRYDRVLYHVGNSIFHQHMFGLLEQVPGVVVLHDFFLAGIVTHMEATGYRPNHWAKTLYESHGYEALRQRFDVSKADTVVWHYPCNLDVLQRALGIVVHSENSRRLASQWYGEGSADDWALVPHLRVPALGRDRAEARRLLGLANDDFVVCSFGLLGPTKLNHRLLAAWLTSSLAKNARCVLVFVGENHSDAYGAEFVTTIRLSGLADRIRVTGWADSATFRQYLEAADVGVQLRTRSRGETSGTVLDCMNYSLPTIVNAHGSMGDLPDDGVWKLPDDFVDTELVVALETLWGNPVRRQQLGTRAREIIVTHHAPRTCADQYKNAIETMYCNGLSDVSSLTRALARVEPLPTESQAWISLAEATALSIPPRFAPRQLLVDISELVQRDSKSGIQRVVHSILKEWLAHPPEGFRVEPVYATPYSHYPDQRYRYARQFTARLLGCPETILTDDPIEHKAGDLFFGLDLQPQVVPLQRDFYRKLRNYGVKVNFVVYDLLPLLLPHAFHTGAAESHQRWLDVVTDNDGAICISKAVAEELAAWMKTRGLTRQRPFKISWFHLGADIEASAFSTGMPEDAMHVLSALVLRPSFLTLGTLEPRKGHAQVLAALESVWAAGVEANLVFVGKQGWMTESLVDRLQNHPELGKRLFWLESISDEYLEQVYEASTCLILASEGEGFGLPLIEAARHDLSIIARDIPVFREIAGEHASYFRGFDSHALADTIIDWLALDNRGLAPRSVGMPWLTWRRSAEQLLARVLQSASQ